MEARRVQKRSSPTKVSRSRPTSPARTPTSFRSTTLKASLSTPSETPRPSVPSFRPITLPRSTPPSPLVRMGEGRTQSSQLGSISPRTLDFARPDSNTLYSPSLKARSTPIPVSRPSTPTRSTPASPIRTSKVHRPPQVERTESRPPNLARPTSPSTTYPPPPRETHRIEKVSIPKVERSYALSSPSISKGSRSQPLPSVTGSAQSRTDNLPTVTGAPPTTRTPSSNLFFFQKASVERTVPLPPPRIERASTRPPLPIRVERTRFATPSSIGPIDERAPVLPQPVPTPSATQRTTPFGTGTAYSPQLRSRPTLTTPAINSRMERATPLPQYVTRSQPETPRLTSSPSLPTFQRATVAEFQKSPNAPTPRTNQASVEKTSYQPPSFRIPNSITRVSDL